MRRGWCESALVVAMAGSFLSSVCLGESPADGVLGEAMAAYRQQAPATPTTTAPPEDDLSGWGPLTDILQVAQADAATAPAEPATAPAGEAFGMAYEPWRTRRGPAYPDDDWHSLGRDLKELPLTLWDDTVHAARAPVFWGGMIFAGAAGIAINGTGVDDTVADRTDGHRHLSKGLDGVGGFFGSPAFHLPLSAGMYAAGLIADDVKLYETSKTLFNAVALNGVLVSALKLAVRTESPNGDESGWPSGHASSSFAVATVMYHAYGPWVGVPLYGFATFVGYERIDARNHDFSDVVSGMVIGIVIGHTVSTNHEGKILGMDVEPWINPETGTVGVVLSKRW